MKIAIVGLGYVGLPVALAFAKKFPGTVGFDINESKIALLKRGIDPSGELSAIEVKAAEIEFSADPAVLKGSNFFVIAVPTPVDMNHNPDLTALKVSSEIVGRALSRGAIVVFESTVYPGVTEEFCGPILESVSGLKRGRDFKLGYSPERINPGDHEHSLERVIKVVSGEDQATLDKVAETYGSIVQAGVFRATSIKVAEAAKVIENTQRDLNIALMNELAMIFDRMGIATRDVLDAASTKWNFLRFSPGLVGGHCIGVDPYYLTTKAEQLGYHPQVILAGRRINDSMGAYVAQKAIKLLVHSGTAVKGAKVGVLGMTFKENVRDLRNSRVPDIVYEFREFGISPLVHDPLVPSADAEEEYGISLCDWEELENLDCLVLAVSHDHYTAMPVDRLCRPLGQGGVFIDVKSVFRSGKVPAAHKYWSL
jgi:UDP-N-acetyl-D-galactosamine dehydrogenase